MVCVPDSGTQGKGQNMNYDKDGATLSVEIPAYTVELDHRELRTLLTYMARKISDYIDEKKEVVKSIWLRLLYF